MHILRSSIDWIERGPNAHKMSLGDTKYTELSSKRKSRETARHDVQPNQVTSWKTRGRRIWPRYSALPWSRTI